MVMRPFPLTAGSSSQKPSSSFYSSLPWASQWREGIWPSLISPLRCNGSEDQCNMKVFVSSLKLFAQRINAN